MTQRFLFPHFNIPGSSFGEEPIEARELDQGMGMAVARRTVFRKEDNEDWGKVADRVAFGNMSLAYSAGFGDELEESYLRNAIASGALLTSGRHLQHGDADQPNKSIELHTNCSTAISSFAKFLLLMNGSGVGRSYDDELMVVDWANAPEILLYISPEHQDHWIHAPERFATEFNISVPEIQDFVDQEILTHISAIPAGSILYRIQDSREGWAKAIEILESLTFKKDNKYPLVLDFSDIRPCGEPIHGMQDRPASGPISLMRGFINVRRDVIEKARKDGMALWEQAMRFDHHFSTEVQVGGARRSARMSMKYWKDPGIIKFIRIKTDNGLWTSNNSVAVDAEFWQKVRDNDPIATEIFDAAIHCAYNNGEPGFINVDKLESHVTGIARERKIDYEGKAFGNKKYKVDAARDLMFELDKRSHESLYPTIVNPCSEIEISAVGGYCLIADGAPLLACPVSLESLNSFNQTQYNIYEKWDIRVEDMLRLAARFLVRANTMDAFYAKETERTNRIGVGLTGVHEWAWLRFGLTFYDMLDEYGKAKDFWRFVGYLSDATKEEANSYSKELGRNKPITVTTAKPSGSVSKLFSLTEGVHLPARKQYIRWVQFRGAKDANGNWSVGSDPLLAEYEERGYPLRQLVSFPGMSIVGFPTEPLITRVMPDTNIVVAPDATPSEQYQYLRLLEKYWIGERQGNQLSYTLKMYTDQYTEQEFGDIVLREQPTIRCCAILPSKPDSEMGYEYLPEEPVDTEEFNAIVAKINSIAEDVDMETLRCANGVCPL